MRAIRKRMSGRLGRSPKIAGVLVLLGLLAFSVFAFNRERVAVTLSSGDTVEADFARAYKLEPYKSVVKIAGVKVGEVTGVKITDRHTAVVSMKLDDGTLSKLGTAPSAAVRPALVVGGS